MQGRSGRRGADFRRAGDGRLAPRASSPRARRLRDLVRRPRDRSQGRHVGGAVRAASPPHFADMGLAWSGVEGESSSEEVDEEDASGAVRRSLRSAFGYGAVDGRMDLPGFARLLARAAFVVRCALCPHRVQCVSNSRVYCFIDTDARRVVRRRSCCSSRGPAPTRRSPGRSSPIFRSVSFTAGRSHSVLSIWTCVRAMCRLRRGLAASSHSGFQRAGAAQLPTQSLLSPPLPTTSCAEAHC